MNRYLNINKLKQQACIDAGYNFKFIIYCNKGDRMIDLNIFG